MNQEELIKYRLAALATRPFRAKFRLGTAEFNMAVEKGAAAMRQHAANLLQKRLFPAAPYKDGRQTPYRGHPVFIAQHATATCCRNCLLKWHKIPKGRPLSSDEQVYVLDVIETWIEGDISKAKRQA